MSEAIGVHPCPYCGQTNNAVTGIDGATDPQPGDRSVCVACFRTAVFVRFAGKLMLREQTPREALDFAASDDGQRVAGVAAAMRRPYGTRDVDDEA